MGVVRLPKNVKLFTAVMFPDEKLLAEVKSLLIRAWGEVESESVIFDFIHSEYYAAEMGTELKKQFITFAKTVPPDFLPDAKLYTNDIEQRFLKDGNRLVNIDPGYVSAANVVLATTKNYMHRIYLGKGIYGDVHLKTSNRRLGPNEWTYADYQTKEALDFFNAVRQAYLREAETQ
jgi:hypothetical protein